MKRPPDDYCSSPPLSNAITMQRIYLLFLLCLLVGGAAFGQSPDKFKFQAVARDAANLPYSNANIAVRVSLVRDGVSGVVDYSERHEVTTTDLGVFDLEIGGGVALSGQMTSLDWGSHPYYLKIDIDPDGGTSYLNLGASQLLSVPYALYARESAGGTGGGDPTDELQNLVYDPTTQTLTITNGNTITLDLSGTGGGTDDQELTLTGTTLSIEGGNSIDLSVLQDGVDDADADPNNEIQDISLSGTALTISNGSTVDLAPILPPGGTDDQNLSLNGTVLEIEGGNSIDLAALIPPGGTDDQELTLTGTTLSIEGGNSIDLSVLQDGVDDADADPNNEIQQLSINGDELSLSNANSITLPNLVDTDDQTLTLTGTELAIDSGNVVDLAGLINDADADPNNELQNISLQGTTLILSNGGSIDLAPLLPPGGSDDQTLSLNGTVLQIEDGNTVDLAGLIPPGGSDDQTLTLNGTILQIEDGNTVDLSGLQDGVNDADSDPTNELQDISLNGTEVSISGGSTLDLGPLLPTPGSDDQTLALNGTALQIEDGNTVDLSGLQDGVNDADSDPTNEIQQLALNGQNELSLTNGGGTIDLSGLAGGSTPWDVDIEGISYDDNVAINAAPIPEASLYVRRIPGVQAGILVDMDDLLAGEDGINVSVAGPGLGLASTTATGTAVQGISDSGAGAFFESTSGPAIVTGVGNVGIGDLNPQDDLSIRRASEDASLSVRTDNAGSEAALRLQNPNGTIDIRRLLTGAPALFGNTPISGGSLFTTDAALVVGTELDDPLHFGTNYEVRATITADGKFGVRDETPAWDFTVGSVNQDRVGIEGGALYFSPSSAQDNLFSIYGAQDIQNPDQSNLYLSYQNNSGLGILSDLRYNSSTGLAEHVWYGRGILPQGDLELGQDGATLGSTLSLHAYYDAANQTQSRFHLVADNQGAPAPAFSLRLEEEVGDPNGPLGTALTLTDAYNVRYLGGPQTGSFLHEFQGTLQTENFGADVLTLDGYSGPLNPQLSAGTTLRHRTGANSYFTQSVFDVLGSPTLVDAHVTYNPTTNTASTVTAQTRQYTPNGQFFTEENFATFYRITNEFNTSKVYIGNTDLNPGNFPSLEIGRDQSGSLNGGGTLYVGNDKGNLAIQGVGNSNAAQQYVRLIATDDNGAGEGNIEMRTRQLSVGVNPGINTAETYAMRVVHDAYGLSIEREGTPAARWEFLSDASTDLYLYANNNARGIFDSASGNYSATSDARLKTNITTLGGVLPQLLQLQPKQYNYKTDLSRVYKGFLAQDIQAVFPGLVTETSGRAGAESTLLVDYAQLGVLGIAATQEQQQLIDAQTVRITQLEQQNADLEARLARLEALLKK